MISKVERNYFLDIPLGILGIVLIITGVMMHVKPQFVISAIGVVKNLHIWSGYAFAILIILHVLWHYEWIRIVTKSVLKVRKKLWIAAACAMAAVIFCAAIASMAPTQKAPHVPGKMPTETRSISQP